MSRGSFLEPETKARSLVVTPEEFVDFLNTHGPDTKCGFCHKGEYGVSPGLSGDAAALVATPVPTHAGVGVWLFPASCQLCGYTVFFNANLVTVKIMETE